MINQLKDEIHIGLSNNPKYVSSKFFYDENGNQIFQKIMHMTEYYLTNSEHEILRFQTPKIWEEISKSGNDVDLVELGPGDGSKMELMIQSIPDHDMQITYYPLDISRDFLDRISERIPKSLPNIRLKCIQNDYLKGLEDINQMSSNEKVILFLGSNIGNFSQEDAIEFLSRIRKLMSDDDFFLIGIDLKKNPQVIQQAYDDPHGITRAFNLNLLVRMNRELKANFDVSSFEYYSNYCPESGEVRSYLVSLKDQEATINKLNHTYYFQAGEVIHTEISKKYDLDSINQLAQKCGFKIVENYFDCKKYFVDSLWKKD